MSKMKNAAPSALEQKNTRRKVPVFYITLASLILLASIAVAALNSYISGRLEEYKSAQPGREAERIFDKYFKSPDFESLIKSSGYVLRYGETLENAVQYFNNAVSNGGLTVSQVMSDAEERSDALSFLVRAGGVNIAKLTIVPSGEMTEHGHILYEEGGIMLIRRERPEPPEPYPAPPPPPGPEPVPEPEEPVYSEKLKKLHSQYVIDAVVAFSKRSRNKISKNETLIYYEPGSEMYNRLNALSLGYVQAYDSFVVEDARADEFVELEDGAFSCRVRYTFRMIREGHADQLDLVDYTLFLRPGNNGKYLIYKQYVTGSVLPPEPEEPKPVIAAQTAVSARLDGADNAEIIDGRRATAVPLKSGQTVQVSSRTPAKYVYVIWNKPPVSPSLTSGGKTYELGRHGFIHEFITLDEASDAIELTAGSGSELCDVYMLNEGVLPDWVQIWQPPLQKADLMLLPTCAGDEFLFFGGILPAYAGELNMAVQVVYMTNHNSNRAHEILDGLWAVGVTAYPVTGPFPDNDSVRQSLEAAERVYGRDKVLAFQVEMLRRFKPVVAVAPDLGGGDGHGARMLNALMLTQALEMSGEFRNFPQSAAAYGVWDVSKAYLHRYNKNEITMDWDVPLNRFDGKTAFETACVGFAMHQSQADYFSALQDEAGDGRRSFGLYRSTVGPDILKNGLLENIPVIERGEPVQQD